MRNLRSWPPKRWRERLAKKDLLRAGHLRLGEARAAHLQRYHKGFDLRSPQQQWIDKSDDLLALYAMTVYWQVYLVHVEASGHWVDDVRLHELPWMEATAYSLQQAAQRCWLIPEPVSRNAVLPAITGQLAKVAADKAVILARMRA